MVGPKWFNFPLSGQLSTGRSLLTIGTYRYYYRIVLPNSRRFCYQIAVDNLSYSEGLCTGKRFLHREAFFRDGGRAVVEGDATPVALDLGAGVEGEDLAQG